MDDSWVTLANWVTAVAVVGSVLALVISVREQRADASESPAVVVEKRPELLDVQHARALLDRREIFFRRRTPPEVESLELLDDDGHVKRYEGLYVLYLGPDQAVSSKPGES